MYSLYVCFIPGNRELNKICKFPVLIALALQGELDIEQDKSDTYFKENKAYWYNRELSNDPGWQLLWIDAVKVIFSGKATFELNEIWLMRQSWPRGELGDERSSLMQWEQHV